ncbi:MAG: hypothetical protein QXP80_01465 [Zestosphaera sp.]
MIPLPLDDVMIILGDLRLHLSLWSFSEVYVETIHKMQDNEGEIDLKIGGVRNKLGIKLKTTKVGDAQVIELEGQGDVYLLFKLDIVTRGLFTLLTGRLTVKSSFLKERRIEDSLGRFIENLRRKLIYELPALVEPLKKEKEKVEAPQPVAAPPPPTVAAVKPSVEPPAPPPPPQPPSESEELFKAYGDPRALEDEVKLSLILLKSQLIASKKEELHGREIITTLKKKYEEVKTTTLFNNLIDDEGYRVKILVDKGKVVGFRVERPDGMIMNGSDALKFTNELPRKSWRIYMYSVPPELAG